MDTPEFDLHGDIKRVSAGHSKHEMTSYACIESLFDFVEEKYKLMNGSDENKEVEAKKSKTDL